MNEIPDKNFCGPTQRNEKSTWVDKYMAESFKNQKETFFLNIF